MKFEEIEPVPYHKTLNPLLWEDDHLKEQVRDKLLMIAKNFITFLNVPDLDVADITISGSNAAFGYTNNSDLDLHVVVNIPKDKPDFVELFDAKKNQYNLEYDITIKQIPVELYVQDSTQKHVSVGIYSVLHDDWLDEPTYDKPTVTSHDVINKAKNYLGRIQHAIRSRNLETATNAMDDIRRLRKAGLDDDGEFGVENLAFKLLRAQGVIDKFRDYINYLQSQELSMNETSRVKLSTDPEYFGATVNDANPLERIVSIPVNKIDVFEPDDKFDDPQNAKNLHNIRAALKKGAKLPPILVRRQGQRFQVLDGHHRFKAYRMAGLKEIPARIVSKSNVKEL